jgi:hypothetical protein
MDVGELNTGTGQGLARHGQGRAAPHLPTNQTGNEKLVTS